MAELEFVTLHLPLEPAIAEQLRHIAEHAGTTPEAMAIEAVTNMVAWIVSGGGDANDPTSEMRMESQIEGQLSFIQSTIDDFDG